MKLGYFAHNFTFGGGMCHILPGVTAICCTQITVYHSAAAGFFDPLMDCLLPISENCCTPSV